MSRLPRPVGHCHVVVVVAPKSTCSPVLFCLYPTPMTAPCLVCLCPPPTTVVHLSCLPVPAWPGGYVSISYAMILPIVLATVDLCSDVLFIRRLSESHFRAGKDYMQAALFVLMTSTGFNFVSFFAVFVHAKNKGKVGSLERAGQEQNFPQLDLVQPVMNIPVIVSCYAYI